MSLLYTITIYLYLLAIRLSAPFNPKAARWLAGRKNWPQRLRRELAAMPDRAGPLVWVHCASLGEFEQGRPVIEALRQRHPSVRILLTFFSPSGYEIRRNYEQADIVTYLPADTPAQARRFVALVQPDLAIFVKYEFWYHHLQAAHRAGVPLVLISALFRPQQVFFRWYGRLFRQLLPLFQRIFVQNESSKELLQGLDLPNVTLAGDTRIDRVLQIAGQARSFPLVDTFAGSASVLVAGSTWPPDEQRLAELATGHLPDDWKVIVAPHQIRESHLQHIEQRFPAPVLRYSRATYETAATARVLLIDNIGMLSALYQYGRIAYIGGGFGAGIHNTLEPVAFGLPVIFGPRYRKFEEARTLSQRGGALPVASTEELIEAFSRLLDTEIWERASTAATAYLKENQGSTEMILEYLAENFEVFRERG